MGLRDYLTRLGGRKRPSLLEERLTSGEKRLLRWSRGVDKVDRFLGPLGSTLEVYGDDFWSGVGTAIGLAELAFIKLPFMAGYYRETKDFSAFYWWGPKEVFANTLPYGGFIDIFHSYTYQTRVTLEQRVHEREGSAYEYRE